MAIDFLERFERDADADELFGRLAVLAVISLGEVPIGQHEFVDTWARLHRGLQKTSAVGLPLADDSGILAAALKSSIGAKEDVFSAAKAVGQCDNGLSALAVK